VASRLAPVVISLSGPPFSVLSFLVPRFWPLFSRMLFVPKLTVEGVGTFEVPQGKRLVLALREEAQTDQLHACGGQSRCTTCRVEFVAGEPTAMTAAEQALLAARGLTGVRLSCQMTCEHDATVRVISRLEGSGRKDCGSPPAAEIVPPPQWVTK
jgi:ferredoxin